MKFGLPTLVECNSVKECVLLANELGLDFVEINMSFPNYTAGRLDVDELKALSDKYGVFYTIHADESLNPFDFNKKVSECYFDVMMDTIRVAKEISAPIINLHLQKGIYVTLPERVILLTDVYFDEYKSNVMRFINMCNEQLYGSDTRIAIENVDTNPFSISQLAMLPEFLSSDYFGLTLDTGHEMALDYKDTQVFEQYGEKLIHMHLHDCKGKKPHLALGDGDVDIKEKLDMLKPKGTCLIEVKTIEGLRRSVEYMKRNGILKEKKQ
jgi:sugar phosphate isomerase/epimerase